VGHGAGDFRWCQNAGNARVVHLIARGRETKALLLLIVWGRLLPKLLLQVQVYVRPDDSDGSQITKWLLHVRTFVFFLRAREVSSFLIFSMFLTCIAPF